MYVSRGSSVEIELILNSLRVSRVYWKPSRRPVSHWWLYCCQEVQSPSTGPTSTRPRSCRRGIRAKREGLPLQTRSLVTTTRLGDCRLRSINRLISCRRLKTIPWTEGPIDSLRASRSIRLVMDLATRDLNTRASACHRRVCRRQKRLL